VHDEMLALFDDCIARMLHLRDSLAATRRVHPGERHGTVLTAIEVTSHFATEAGRTVATGFATGFATASGSGAAPGPATTPDPVVAAGSGRALTG
jgi:hypothetical protein